jgi:hypothetical protein
MSHFSRLGDEDVPRRDRHAAVAAAQARRTRFGEGIDQGSDQQPRSSRELQATGDETYTRVHDARRSSAADKKNKYSIQKRGYVADEEAVSFSTFCALSIPIGKRSILL